MELSSPDYIILIVEDLDRALRFYTGVLGLPLGHRSGDYAQLDTGATRLALYTRSAMAKTLSMSLEAPPANAPGFEIGFKVADVDTAFNDLVAQALQPLCRQRIGSGDNGRLTSAIPMVISSNSLKISASHDKRRTADSL